MSFRIFLHCFFTVIFIFGSSSMAAACESCAIANLGREQRPVQEGEQRWFVKYTFEEQNWHEKEAGEAHALHHQGHDFHDKTTEFFQHLTVGNHLTDDLTVSTEIPYVIRNSLEVDSHAILGAKQRSEGLGDVRLIGDCRFLKRNDWSLSAITGIKFPTGSTKQENTAGTRFEPELQPGSGSFDYIAGGVYHKDMGRTELTGNVVYVFKTEGDQDFKFGDLLSTSLLCNYVVNPQNEMFRTKIGLDMNLQYEQKHQEAGEKVKDSGGTTLFLGPVVTVDASKNVSLFASFLPPVYQKMGGVHQTLDYAWTAGAKASW